MTNQQQSLMTDTMTEEEYSMYLAYGYTSDNDVYENWDLFSSDPSQDTVYLYSDTDQTF